MSNYKGPYDLTDKADADALGTAATSDVTTSTTDTTAGRLLKVGDFGLGATGRDNGFSGDIDDPDALLGGLYSIVDTTVSGTLPSQPSSMRGATLFVETYRVRAGGRFVKQTLTANADRGGNSYYRLYDGRNGGSWTPWREIYHTGNVVGTVSQSGGVPTGAIIQRGSNVNGEFVRYADGTQICWKDNVSCVYVTTASLIYDASYPAAFIATPSLNANLFSPFDYNGTQYTSAQVADGVTRPLLRSFGDSSTRISFNIQRPSPSQSWNSDDDLKANFTAIGRWY